MLKRFLVLALGLALVACGPQQPPATQPASHVLLEYDLAELQAVQFNNVISNEVRDKLRESPSIELADRKVVGDHLEVKVANPADVQAAAERIQSLSTTGYAVTARADNVIELKVNDSLIWQVLQVETLLKSLQVVEKRIDAAGFSKATVESQPPNRLLVQTPGLSAEDTDRLIEIVTRPGVLTLNLVDEGANPADYVPSVEQNGRIALPDDSQGGAPRVLYTDPIVTNSDIADTSPIADLAGRSAVAFRLTPPAAKRFGDATTNNIGRAFAIVLDDRIISAPIIRMPITGGSGQISGAFTQKEAEDLAIILRSEPLPIRLKVVERVFAPQ